MSESIGDSTAQHKGSEHFATYLAKQLTGAKRFRLGAPDEAAPLVAASDIVLSHGDLALTIVCIVDGEGAREKRFALSQAEIVSAGKACLPYTGTVNGTKMPVTIVIYEIAESPLVEADRARLQSLQKIPGFAKVAIRCFRIDLGSKTVFSTAFLNGRLAGRPWLETLLREPRRQDGEISVRDAALPTTHRKPIVTGSLVAVLLGVFVLEQLVKTGGRAQGLLGVDPPTLFAMGGMNADAVSKQGELYRLFSAALLHADAVH